MAVSGVGTTPPPVISQEVARKPDVESTAASQGQSQPTAKPQRSVMVASTSATSLSLEAHDSVYVHDEEIIVMNVIMKDETPSSDIKQSS
jgi:hypothetical protein